MTAQARRPLPVPVAERLITQNASLRAEVRAAQQRTRDIEAARQALEAELGGMTVQAVSDVVTLIRHLGIGRDVIKVLGALYDWHPADTTTCEKFLYGEVTHDDDD